MRGAVLPLHKLNRQVNCGGREQPKAVAGGRGRWAWLSCHALWHRWWVVLGSAQVGAQGGNASLASLDRVES